MLESRYAAPELRVMQLLLAGVLPQPGLQLPVLGPPDLYLMPPEQVLDATASVSQQPQQLHQHAQHQQSQPQHPPELQQQQQQQQQQPQAGLAEHAQHGLSYASEDFALPPLQGDAGGFPQIGVGEHVHVQVPCDRGPLQSRLRCPARSAAGWMTTVGTARALSMQAPPLKRGASHAGRRRAAGPQHGYPAADRGQHRYTCGAQLTMELIQTDRVIVAQRRTCFRLGTSTLFACIRESGHTSN